MNLKKKCLEKKKINFLLKIIFSKKSLEKRFYSKKIFFFRSRVRFNFLSEIVNEFFENFIEFCIKSTYSFVKSFFFMIYPLYLNVIMYTVIKYLPKLNHLNGYLPNVREINMEG